MADEVLCEIDGHVALITLNRPDQRNAVNPALTEAMAPVMERFESDPEIWVGILTGAGDRAFSAGAALTALASGQAAGIASREGGFAGFVRFPRTKPVIAAVNGAALAGGCELVLACDIVVAAEHARFGLPEVSRGIIAAAGGVFRLPRSLPRARAMEMILTAEPIEATEAHALGLVNHVVPASEVVSTARGIAQRICDNAPLAVRESRAIALAALEITEEEGWQLSAAASARIFRTEDAMEGPRAFAEKRAPQWKGR
jgi:enoyl-CoA hydratase/carnithine racemase